MKDLVFVRRPRRENVLVLCVRTHVSDILLLDNIVFAFVFYPVT